MNQASSLTKKNVLVFPCGSEIGLELYRSLSASTHFNLIGGSSVDDHGQFVYSQYVEGLPFVEDEAFTEKLNALVEAYRIDFIFPAHDSVVLKLSQEKAAGNIKCAVITASVDTCEVARSKLKTYEQFAGIIPTPDVYKRQDITEDILPLFLKPDVGQGSKGTVLAKTLAEIDFYVAKDPSLLLLEYLPGKEYTVDCFTDRHGNLLFSEGRERIRIANGISVRSTKVSDERFNALARKINRTLSFRGVWFFQVKEDKKGELVLMEIAPRVAGTMGLARCNGVNLPLLSLFDSMDVDVTVFANKYNLVIDRALQNSYQHDIEYSHVYLDFDDLVVFEGKVHPGVMAFVFQCINKDIKVHLLTRHQADLPATLERYRLSNVFDELTWLKDADDEKYVHVTEKDAIFIDDSFVERKKVYDHCGIAVFDSHMLESLMEKF